MNAWAREREGGSTAWKRDRGKAQGECVGKERQRERQHRVVAQARERGGEAQVLRHRS